MLEGPFLLLIIGLAVLFIVVSSSLLKLHPFVSLLLATFGVGLAVGMPLPQIIETINTGFGGLMGYIGLIVVLGSVIGVILERSGAAIRIANLILQLIGPQRPALAMSVIGAVVGIPVFCDSGFIILARLNKVLADRTGQAQGSLALTLSSGLYTTHTLVPPTPGPIAAAGNLGASDFLGTVILLGLLVSVPAVLVAYFYALRMGPQLKTAVTGAEAEQPDQPKALPSAFKSLAPILVPILLIALGSFGELLTLPSWLTTALVFIGNPLTALLIGLFFAFLLFPRWDAGHLSGWVGQGISQAGPILVLTGAGGAFGALLKATPIADLVNTWIAGTPTSGTIFLVIAFLIAAFLKTAQGSTTSALVITSSLLAPLVAGVGFTTPVGLALVVMAMGGGAMAVSHANDSYFWVVSQFSGFRLKDAYRGFTVMTLLQGITVLLTTLLLYGVMGNM